MVCLICKSWLVARGFVVRISKVQLGFRVSPVMTTSISLRIKLCLNFARFLQGRWENAFIQNSRKMKHLRGNRRKRELLRSRE